MEMGQTCSKNEGQQMDQTLHRVATKEREEIKGDDQAEHGKTTKQRRNHLEKDSSRQKTMEDIDGGLILQWMDKAYVKWKWRMLTT